MVIQRFFRLVVVRVVVRLRDRVREPAVFEEPVLRRVERFVSLASARCLFTVAAAISFARRGLRPRCCSDSMMCSYCRTRFALRTPRGGIQLSSCPPPNAGEMPRVRCVRWSPNISVRAALVIAATPACLRRRSADIA